MVEALLLDGTVDVCCFLCGFGFRMERRYLRVSIEGVADLRSFRKPSKEGAPADMALFLSAIVAATVRAACFERWLYSGGFAW